MLRSWRWAGLFFITLGVQHAQPSSPSGAPSSNNTSYAKPETCAACHRGIWDTYMRTGMARSFSRPTPSNAIEDFSTNNGTYHHKPSDSYFSMLRRDGNLYQRRYQLDPTGKQINVMEKQVDFIMGSGNHARAYLHRTARNTLIEMPLAWYSEKGGYWAMNPGYDRPDHDGFRRPIAYDCMFCHNGYPQIPAGHVQPFAEPVYTGSLPEGIDCQRCHGPGRKHTQLASTPGIAPQDIRAAIVNPSRLTPDRQMEVCMVCHLETTSFPLPNAIQRYERGPFSFNPGEPMSAFILTFDHAAGTGREDKFEIVSAAYRLRRSACFLKSSGKLLCTTCHNPHDIPRGHDSANHYNSVCHQCHASAFNESVQSGKHTASSDCITCHMPKRRTEDVVHVAVTDHYIQRNQPNADLLGEIPERHETGSSAYHGPVALYYPPALPHTSENDLYLAIAQVTQRSNLAKGITQLTAAIEHKPPTRAEYYFALAEALRDNGQLEKAVPLYKESIRRNPKFVAGMQKLGYTLRISGRNVEALATLKRAATLDPENFSIWLELGLTYRALGKTSDALLAFQKVVALEPDTSEAHNNLGIIYYAGRQVPRAEASFREAIRIQPDYADAHGNLAALLSANGALADALNQFEIALRLRPSDANTRYNYALALGRSRQFDKAQRELETSLQTDPNLTEAHLLLGDLLMAKDQASAALSHYRDAVRLAPQSGRAQLALGSTLAATGDVAAAIPHLQKALADSDPSVRDNASHLLRQVAKRP